MGIALDGLFLVVDIDRPEISEARVLSTRVLECSPWVQKTPRGYHFLFRVPPEWKGTNVSLRSAEGTYGDLKSRGYIVGPGSVVNGVEYACVDAVEPPLAPPWLLEMATRPERVEQHVEERSGIPAGEHDAFLVRMAGYLRGREGLSERTIRAVLEAGPLVALEGSDESRPYTERDFSRIAHSVSKYEANRVESLDLVHPTLRIGSTVTLIKPPIEWHVRGFVPCGELVLMYGPGGIGKSSFGSWLCAEVTRKGKRFCYMGTEEPPERFLGRSQLAGANLDLTYDVVNPGRLKFPRDANLLREMILESKIDLLYIDSIYTHFEHREGVNAAEKARDSLAPLLAIAHETGASIFGVFHTNKAGTFLGSTEMENVTRVLLEAKRASHQTYLGVKVHKTNLYNPGKMMRLEGREEVFRDAEGNVQEEIDENGKTIPLLIIVPARIADIDDDEAPIEFDQEEVGPVPAVDPGPSKDRVRAYLLEHGMDVPNQRVAEALNLSVGYIGKIRSENDLY